MNFQTLSGEEEKVFNEVYNEVCEYVHTVMVELWRNWTNLGLDNSTKISIIKKLPTIEKELHNEILLETREKLKKLTDDIHRIQEETQLLARALSIQIHVMKYNGEMKLSEYKEKLEEQISGYKEQVQQRQMRMERLFEWQNMLKEKLGVSMDAIREDPLPSEEELNELNERLVMLQNECDRRLEIFLNTQAEVKDIIEKLQIKPQNNFEQTVVTSLSVNFPVTDLNMERLHKLRQDFQEKYEHTNNRVLELREHLTKLWDCMEEDHVYRESFLQLNPGCNSKTEAAIREEIKRCEIIKKQKIKLFIANVRTKIKLMWDNCLYSDKQREEFVHYFHDIFTEDSLTLHELYLNKITKFYEEHKILFELTMARKNLWVKMLSLDAREFDPNRYHNRGGRLLQEEKERKATGAALAKIEKQLQSLVAEYEAKTGQVFTVEGKPLLQVIEEEWEQKKSVRQSKVLASRKQALTPNTPRNPAISPGKRNRTAAGLPHTNERNKPPIKRLLITGSAVAATTFTNRSPLKRSAMSTVKRRVSGRVAAQKGLPKRKIDYNGEEVALQKVPKVNGSILNYKRMSVGKRRSRRSSSINSHVTTSQEPKVNEKEPPPVNTTTYTDFKESINERAISRSSLANKTQEENQHEPLKTINENKAPTATPKKTPIIKVVSPLTPKAGKENIQLHNVPVTPKSNLFYTPSRLTRSAIKLNNDGFATPLAPLSANKASLKRQEADIKTPNALRRSQTHTNFRAKKLPNLF